MSAKKGDAPHSPPYPDKQQRKQNIIKGMNTKRDKIEKKTSLKFGNIKINRNFAVQKHSDIIKNNI